MFEIPTKPKPNGKFLALDPKRAAVVAFKIAKHFSSDGEPDWGLFKEFTAAHEKARTRNVRLPI